MVSAGRHSDIRVGVLALQGDFADHLDVLGSCGYRKRAVRTAFDLESCDALIIPGGESTTMLKLIDRVDLREPLTKRINAGMPAFGTCAGAIVLAGRVSDGEAPLGVLPIEIQRNAYGRQAESFEADIDVPHLGYTVRGVFIRAPVISSVGDGAEVLANLAGHPVLVQSDRVLAATFHPELVGEVGLHRYFVEEVCVGEALARAGGGS
ncbi:MAG: pyridoxal 5'-phosphate synthase glutaminase subunit PdxT [Actinomycetota bacterium]